MCVDYVYRHVILAYRRLPVLHALPHTYITLLVYHNAHHLLIHHLLLLLIHIIILIYLLLLLILIPLSSTASHAPHTAPHASPLPSAHHAH